MRSPNWLIKENWIGLVIVGILLGQIGAVSGMSPRVGDDERIRILYIGGQFGASPPCLMLMNDPKVTISVVLTTGYARELEYSQRYMRIYFPRNYQDLVSTKDVVVIADAEVDVFTATHHVWIKNAVMGAGLGLTMAGGACTFGANEPFRSWDETAVGYVLPVRGVYGKELGRYSHPGLGSKILMVVKHKVVRPENELMSSLPWEEAPPIYPPNVIFPKEGAIVLAESQKNEPLPNAGGATAKIPLMTYWDLGNGRALAIQDFHSYFSEFYTWRFYPDSVINQHYFAAGVPVPQDPFLMNDIRDNFRQYEYRKILLFQVLDFIARFGASTAPLEKKIGEPDTMKVIASDLYVDQKYAECTDEIRTAIELIDVLIREAFELKDKALLWVHFIEWLTVTGTLMICGFFLWAIMVRRKLYHEVVSTRKEQR